MGTLGSTTCFHSHSMTKECYPNDVGIVFWTTRNQHSFASRGLVLLHLRDEHFHWRDQWAVYQGKRAGRDVGLTVRKMGKTMENFIKSHGKWTSLPPFKFQTWVFYPFLDTGGQREMVYGKWSTRHHPPAPDFSQQYHTIPVSIHKNVLFLIFIVWYMEISPIIRIFSSFTPLLTLEYLRG